MINRTFHCIIYTTTYVPDTYISIIKENLMKARGISDITFEVREIDVDFSTYSRDFNEPNGTTVNWPWIKKNITGQRSDMECIHLTPSERERLGMKHPTCDALGGLYDVDHDNTLDFLVLMDIGVMSGNYPNLPEFVRIFIHEVCHGFDHWTNSRITPIVHEWDEGMHRLLELPGRFNFEEHNILSEAIEIAEDMVELMHTPLSEAAKKFLKTDASPNDEAPDMLACAETVSCILKQVMVFPTIISTAVLREKLRSDNRFSQVDGPVPNAIIISATGLSKSIKVPHGHVGIVCSDGYSIMSNNSPTGTLEENYTVDSWKKRWGVEGYPIEYFVVKQ